MDTCNSHDLEVTPLDPIQRVGGLSFQQQISNS